MDADNTTPVASGDNPGMGNADATNETVPTFENDVDRWKHFARLHESKWQKASSQLEAERAKAGELETKLSQMRQEHSLDMASRDLNHLAQQRGIQLDAEAISKINVSAFLDEDGNVNQDEINLFLNHLAPPARKFADPKDLGIGPQGGPSGDRVSRAQLKNMSPADIAKAAREGRIEGQRNWIDK